MKLKTTLSVMNGCVISILPIAALVYWLPVPAQLLILMVPLAVFAFFRFRYLRCPHCGGSWRALRIPHFCPNCGHSLNVEDRYPEK